MRDFVESAALPFVSYGTFNPKHHDRGHADAVLTGRAAACAARPDPALREVNAAAQPVP